MPMSVDLDMQGGTPCFAGTRVPVKALFDAIEGGSSLEKFLSKYPSVSDDQARRVLQQAEYLIETQAPCNATDPNEPIANDISRLEGALDEAGSILRRLDEDGNPVVDRKALARAADFLRRSTIKSRMSFRRTMQMPTIGPGPDGSVDLHWLTQDSETLVNIPADPASPVTFYGDDREGNSVKGSLVSDDNGGLVLWLTMKQ